MTDPIRLSRWSEFSPGMIHGVFGPSGAGKTTWLRHIIGLDQVPAQYPKEVAFLSQNPHLIPHDTIRQQVLWFGDPESLLRWAPILDLSETLLDRYPGELSGGQYQRAALLRVLVTERPILVLDEPLSQIEDSRRFTILETLRTYITTVHPDRLIILSSHHWDDLWLVSDTLSLREPGFRSGPHPTATVYRNPPTPGFARLFGYVASIPCPQGGYWLVHPMSLTLESHHGPGITLQGTFQAARVGASVRQWVFHCEEPHIRLRWPGLPALIGTSLPNHIRLVDPPWVPYRLPPTQEEETP